MSKVNWFALLLFLLFLAHAPAQPEFTGSPDAEPGFGLYAAEAGGALLLGPVLTAGIILYADAKMLRVQGDPEIHSIPLTFFAMASAAVVCPLGSAAGASIVGGIKQQHGSFGAAYIGALLGIATSFGIAGGALALPGNYGVLKGTLFVASCLTPPIGATVGIT